MHEFQKLANYLENKVFFQSMENMVRNDILKAVDQIFQSILESLDLNLELTVLNEKVENLLELNVKFQKSKDKILIEIFENMLNNLKTFINESVVQSKETFKRSKVRIKYVGYLKYFQNEVEE